MRPTLEVDHMLNTAVLIAALSMTQQGQEKKDLPVLTPEGWSMTADSSGVRFTPPTKDAEVRVHQMPIEKDTEPDFSAWLRSTQPGFRALQFNLLTSTTGGKMFTAFGEDSSRNIRAFVGNASRDLIKVVEFRAPDLLGATRRLPDAHVVFTSWVAMPPAMTAFVDRGDRPIDDTRTMMQKPAPSQFQLVYEPGRGMRLMRGHDMAMKFAGTYRYRSNFISSPIGEAFTPGIANTSAAMQIQGNSFALEGQAFTGRIATTGNQMRLSFGAQGERHQIKVLEAQNGVATMFAVGPCVYVRDRG